MTAAGTGTVFLQSDSQTKTFSAQLLITRRMIKLHIKHTAARNQMQLNNSLTHWQTVVVGSIDSKATILGNTLLLLRLPTTVRAYH